MEQQNQDSSLFQFNIDANNASALKSAASWAKVLAILGFIFGAMFIILGIAVQSALRTTSTQFEGYSYKGSTSMLAGAGLAIYAISGIITIIGSIFALNFGNKVSAALRTNDANLLRAGFAGARNYFAFWAVLMIICLLLMVVTLAGGGLGRM